SHFFFFFPTLSTPQSSPLSLHDALPIFGTIAQVLGHLVLGGQAGDDQRVRHAVGSTVELRPTELAAPMDRRQLVREPLGDLLIRSEEHTSELQSRENLVCRLLLEKKKKT